MLIEHSKPYCKHNALSGDDIVMLYVDMVTHQFPYVWEQ